MSVQRAIQIQGAKAAKLVADAPIPPTRPNHIRVRTSHVALNPTDWRAIDGGGAPGATSGCDYSGIVEEVGRGADSHGLRVGDRVAGAVHGANTNFPQSGAFAEHVVAKPALAIRVPENVSLAEAATLGVGITTVALALYRSLQLPWPTAPTKEPFPVLVYGGSTATGTLAIQYAKLSGCAVLTTCSPRNFELVRALGADRVFDYRASGVGAEIREAAGGKLAHVLDCISSPASAAICAEAVGDAGGRYTSLLPVFNFPREDVQTEHVIGYTAFGEEVSLGSWRIPARPEDLECATRFWKLTGELLAQGKIRVHRPEVREGGLAGVLDGLDDLRQGRVSGVKLVYKV
ncbi:putative zinc-binding oxidoreductase ToxD [Macrophomina phaseolina]|uniref:Zinc-binding oxidoreductase ToxD n=1 Tax=Macrophomina phaseolina TaxID=35725 RepID=A0ABQ8G0Q1_9PEZI|nr:putative zinc-binding oxidoreductase ToxD [Macrophomina phaseolina]